MRRMLSLMLALCCLMTIGSPLTVKGEEGMDDQYLLIDGNAPEPSADPQMEDFTDKQGMTDMDALFAALTEAEEKKAAMPVQSEEDLLAQRAFLRAGLETILSGRDGENALYSPLNLYFSLGLLAQITGGGTQAQLLSVLQAEDAPQLAQRLKAMWFSVHRNYGGNRSGMASSLWLNEKLRFDQQTLQRLADEYFTSSYLGEMGSEGLDRALQSWLNAGTGDSLENLTSGIHLESGTALALAATIDCRIPWADAFAQEDTAPGVFHAPGGELQTDFMHRSADGWLYAGRQFSAAEIPLAGGGQMRLILPDEGVSPEALLQDAQMMDYLCLLPGGEWPEQKYLRINMAVPKFDVTCDLRLEESLQQMGAEDVFSPEKADFTPAAPDTEGVALSKVMHAARVRVDEEGVAASAYTVMLMAMGMMLPQEEETDFVLDRPFLFEMTGEDGSVLFVGIVNCP